MDPAVTRQPSGFGSVTHEGMTIGSNTETAAEIRAALELDTPDPEPEPQSDPEPDPERPAAETPAEDTPKLGKPRNDPRARVADATAKEAAAKRERDEAKAEAANLKARLAELEARSKPEPVKPPAPVTPDAEPTVDQFDSYEKFVKAQARWEANQAFNEREQARQREGAMQARDQQIREVDRQFGERYNAILTKDPEFTSKVNPALLNTPRMGVLPDPSKGTFGNFLVEQVFQSENPEALLLHLSNIAEVQRLATLPPIQVLRELAKVEAQATQPGAASSSGPAPVAVSHAKRPIQPLGSSHISTADEDLEAVPFAEYVQRQNAADRARSRRG